jgi:CDP-diacylglycerol--serine O-phosphatidyltransferase
MIRFIPNLLTLLNLGSGCLAVVFAFTADLRMVSLMILISLILDYLDGTAARLLNVQSELGKELDSLADVVSFGLVPSLIAFVLLQANDLPILSYTAFLMTLFSAYRLANFNIDKRQSNLFIGLPTPANAMVWASFPLIIFDDSSSKMVQMFRIYLENPYVILFCVALFSYLLVAEIELFSLKFKNLSWKENKVRFIFMLLAVALISIFSFYAIPFIILLYILISLITNNISKRNEIQGRN